MKRKSFGFELNFVISYQINTSHRFIQFLHYSKTTAFFIGFILIQLIMVDSLTTFIWTKLNSGIWWPAERLATKNTQMDCFSVTTTAFAALLFSCDKTILLSESDRNTQWKTAEDTTETLLFLKQDNIVDDSLRISFNNALNIAETKYPYSFKVFNQRNENNKRVLDNISVSESTSTFDSSLLCQEIPIINEPQKKFKRQRLGKRINAMNWDDYFMSVAFLSAMRSKDPSTQVGACIVNEDKRIVGIGYNGFPRGCSDDILPWDRQNDENNELDTKYPYVVHAEVNAILNKNSAEVRGCMVNEFS